MLMVRLFGIIAINRSTVAGRQRYCVKRGILRINLPGSIPEGSFSENRLRPKPSCRILAPAADGEAPKGLEYRDKYAVSTITPGTKLYKTVKALGAKTLSENDINQIKVRGKVQKKITKEWGVLKKLKKKRKKKKKKKKKSS